MLKGFKDWLGLPSEEPPKKAEQPKQKQTVTRVEGKELSYVERKLIEHYRSRNKTEFFRIANNHFNVATSQGSKPAHNKEGGKDKSELDGISTREIISSLKTIVNEDVILERDITKMATLVLALVVKGGTK